MLRWIAAPLLCIPLLCAPPEELSPLQVERLVGMAKAWGKVRIWHPDLLVRPIDWDRALTANLPALAGDPPQEAYQAAVAAMLAELGDPATRVLAREDGPAYERPALPALCTWLDERTLVLHLNEVDRLAPGPARRPDLIRLAKEAIARSERLMVDLRMPRGLFRQGTEGPRRLGAVIGLVFDALAPQLVQAPLPLPATLAVARIGHRGDILIPEYSEGLRLAAGTVVQPAGGPGPRQICFLVNDQTAMPSAALALKQAGIATLVTEGDPGRDWGATTVTQAIPGGFAIQVRTGSLVFADGRSKCLADRRAEVVLQPGAPPSACAVVESWWPSRDGRGPLPTAGQGFALPRSTGDSAYPEMMPPSRPFRILAAVKFWTTIDQFFPYKDLLDEPWDDRRLAGFIQALAAAQDQQGYELAVASMLATIQDSHGRLTKAGNSFLEGMPEPDGYAAHLGSGSLPCMVQMIEGAPVVARTWADPEAVHTLRPGDTILAVDGEAAAARMRRLQPLIPASTPHRKAWLLANHLLRGPRGAQGWVEVRRMDGRTERLAVVWGQPSGAYRSGGRSGPEFHLLEGDIGYVDLDRISPDQLEPLRRALAASRAVILDMRGYPTGPAMRAIGMFMSRDANPTYLSERPVAQAEARDQAHTLRMARSDRVASGAGYSGRVVMLLDERSQSAAETMALFAEAASEVLFVGSPTSGANGNVSTVLLPGGLRLFFTGEAIRHGDGRQLQRKGIQPDLPVRPTAAGLAAGRDEVLERALQELRGKGRHGR